MEPGKAETSEAPAGAPAAPGAGSAADAGTAQRSGPAGGRKQRRQRGLPRLIASLLRLADVQYRIWLVQAKLTALRIALFAGLFAGAALLSVLAIIFLYIGAFKVLTDLLEIRAVYAFLLFGGFHLALAGALVFTGVHLLSQRDEKKKDKPGGGGAA